MRWSRGKRPELREEALLEVLDARKIALTEAQRAVVRSCTDAKVRGAWVVRAATATTADEIFGPRSTE
jgi:hypothetical protein